MNAIQMKNLLLSLAADQTVPLETIELAISRYIVGKPILPVTDFAYAFVVRCSPNNIGLGEVFNHVSRCSYNPCKKRIGIQRCNYPGQQVFYAAVTSETKSVKASTTAIMETAFGYVKDKSISRFYFTLSKWRLKRQLRLFVLPFAKRSRRNNFEFRKMNRLFNKILHEAVLKHGSDYNDLKTFLTFISNVLCTRSKGNYYYRISSAFYNSILSFAPEIDGLIYPSAMTKAEGMNVALRKNLIDDGVLEVEVAVMYVMQKSPTNAKEIRFLKGSSEAYPDKHGKLYFQHIF